MPGKRRHGANLYFIPRKGARRLRDAAEAGCRWAVTESYQDVLGNPNPSYHNMMRTGFTLGYPQPNYFVELFVEG